jgi:hypothetical protein
LLHPQQQKSVGEHQSGRSLQPTSEVCGAAGIEPSLQVSKTLSAGVFLTRIVNSGFCHIFLFNVDNFSPSLINKYNNNTLKHYITRINKLQMILLRDIT